MARIPTFRKLPDQSFDHRVTDLSRPLKPISPTTEGVLDTFQNRNMTTTTPYQLIANQSIRALPRNPRRVGLLIQNLDATAIGNYSLGNDLADLGLQIAAGGAVLFDFTCPPDEVYLFSTANIRMMVVDITRGYTPAVARKVK